MSVFKHSCDH